MSSPNQARKNAARQLAATTGISYTAALRQLNQPPTGEPQRRLVSVSDLDYVRFDVTANGYRYEDVDAFISRARDALRYNEAVQIPATFRRVTEGYDQEQVDEFVHRVLGTLATENRVPPRHARPNIREASLPGPDDPWHVFPFNPGIAGEPVQWDVNTAPHMLVVGGAGTGRLLLINTVAASAAASGHWDVSGVSFDTFGNVGWASAGDRDEATTLLHDAHTEMEARYAALSAANFTHYTHMDDTRPVLVIVDEAEKLLDAQDDLADRNQGMIGRIARLGRAAGVHLLMGTGRVDAKLIPASTRTMFDAAVVCGPLHTPSARTILGNLPENVPPSYGWVRGEAVLRVFGKVLPFVIDSPPEGWNTITPASGRSVQR